jgi:S1-C subfamily serine protease
MKSYLAVGLISAVAGMLLAWGLTRPGPNPMVAAQDRPGRESVTTRRSPASTPRESRSPAPALPAPDIAPAPADDAKDEWTAEERVNIWVYEHANKGVVNITTRSPRGDSFFSFESVSEGAGSGSVLDKEGHILTNYHVISGAAEIAVTLFNGESYEGAVVGQDPVNDIAVLRIEAKPEVLFPMTPGDSSKLRVGQQIFAIGNPFGLERTLTTGIVSSLNRSIPGRAGRSMKQIIQIDAALNQGNSGGPLLDSRGRLVGMNTAIASRTGENTGVGFAIPVNTIRRVAPELISTGRVTRADLGVARVYETEQGLVIATLTPGGPAERAGLRGFRIVRNQRRSGPFVYEERNVDRRNADTIVSIDSQPTPTADALLALLEEMKPGHEAMVGVIRGGKTVDVPVVLGTEEE